MGCVVALSTKLIVPKFQAQCMGVSIRSLCSYVEVKDIDSISSSITIGSKTYFTILFYFYIENEMDQIFIKLNYKY